ncbi:MAG: phosphoribosylformylglycinamidine synthase I [Planctomycetota bacterium]
MSAPKVLVLRAAGTNCDRETAHAFELCGAETEIVHVNRLLQEPGMLAQYKIFALPGGFSYGDAVAAGRVLAVELRSHAMAAVHDFIADGGLILGICNGFQVLVKAGILPGPASQGQVTSVVDNDSHRYQDQWVELEVATDRCVFVQKGERYLCPIAHAEGKFVAPDPVLDALEERGQVVFRYAANPNGSHRDIAGICDETGRVLGLMPHPERHVTGWHHPYWTRNGLKDEGDGIRLFRNAVAAVS